MFCSRFTALVANLPSPSLLSHCSGLIPRDVSPIIYDNWKFSGPGWGSFIVLSNRIKDDPKDIYFKCVYLVKPIFLGYKVIKEGSLGWGKVGLKDLPSNSFSLYCLHHPPTQYTLCVRSWTEPFRFPDSLPPDCILLRESFGAAITVDPNTRYSRRLSRAFRTLSKKLFLRHFLTWFKHLVTLKDQQTILSKLSLSQFVI